MNNRIYFIRVLFAVLAFFVIKDVRAASWDSYDFEENDFRYKITSTVWNTVEITYYPSWKDVNGWPVDVEYKGVKYYITSIGKSAFQDNKNLKWVWIPDYVTEIDESAFQNCVNLTTVVLPQNLRSIGKMAFFYCSSLKEVTLPEGLEVIGVNAFTHCGLTTVEIPQGVIRIDDYAFSACHDLERAVIKSDIEKIGGNIFAECEKLTYFSQNVYNCYYLETLGFYGALYDKRTKTILSYPGGSTAEAYVIPEGPEVIKVYAFAYNNYLKSVTLPSTMKDIDYFAFSRTSIDTLRVYSKQSPFKTNVLYDMENIVLVVPYGAKGIYGEGWKEVVEMDPIYLDIKQADVGNIKLLMDFGQHYSLIIDAPEGWQVHSITLDGEDVTEQLTEQNIFIVPSLAKSAVLSVVYEKYGGPITEVDAWQSSSVPKVLVRENSISITNISQQERVWIYNASGQLIRTFCGECILSLFPNSTYLIKTSSRVLKVKL